MEPLKNDSESETIREHAAQFVARLQELLLHVDSARENTERPPPPERIDALISDSLSLAEAISTGAVVVSQPRIARNLIEVVENLDHLGHHPLAAEFTSAIRWISTRGIAAENCSLGRSRVAPGKH